jgi:hypothetical protein
VWRFRYWLTDCWQGGIRLWNESGDLSRGEEKR